MGAESDPNRYLITLKLYACLANNSELTDTKEVQIRGKLLQIRYKTSANNCK